MRPVLLHLNTDSTISVEDCLQSYSSIGKENTPFVVDNCISQRTVVTIYDRLQMYSTIHRTRKYYAIGTLVIAHNVYLPALQFRVIQIRKVCPIL